MKVHGQLGAVLVAHRHGLVRAQGVQRGVELLIWDGNVIPASGSVYLLPERFRGGFGVFTVGVERAAMLGEDDVAVVVGLCAAVPRVSCGVRVVLGDLGGGHEAVGGNQLVDAMRGLTPRQVDVLAAALAQLHAPGVVVLMASGSAGQRVRTAARAVFVFQERGLVRSRMFLREVAEDAPLAAG